MKINEKYRKVFLVLISLVAVIIIAKRVFFEKLKIVAPNDYVGQVSLVLSNVDILNVDSNGIGYLTEETFNKRQLEPDIYNVNGQKINDRAVGFNPSTFWGLGTTSYAKKENSSNEPETIKYFSFELVPENKKGQKQYYNVDLLKLVDKKKIISNNETSRKTEELSSPFDSLLREFVALHKRIDGLYFGASFYQVEDELRLFLFTCIHQPEIIKGDSEVKGYIDKGKFNLLIVDEKKPLGVECYNINELNEIPKDNNDDMYTAPYRQEYKIKHGRFIRIE
ncbi:MAG: hypothetical protein RIC95_09545 [Vicingaceae bacterium]